MEVVTIPRERVAIWLPLKPCLGADHLGVLGTVKELTTLPYESLSLGLKTVLSDFHRKIRQCRLIQSLKD